MFSDQYHLSETNLSKYKPSGALLKETNLINGVIVKYSAPGDAIVPQASRWTLHVFKNNEQIDMISLYEENKSSFLIGREEKIADISLEHPSCSNQHAVIQFRKIPLSTASVLEHPKFVIRPYLMDLHSTNGTLLNRTLIDSARFVELRHKDIIKFGYSTREYVLLKEE